jgi:hypothetical protein
MFVFLFLQYIIALRTWVGIYVLIPAKVVDETWAEQDEI